MRSWRMAAVGFVLGALLTACGGAPKGSGAPTSAPSSTKGGSHHTTTSSSSSTTTTSTTLALTGDIPVLEIGDSLGEDLGFGLSYEFANDPHIHFYADAVGDTGLVRPDFYNWPAHLASELASDHPKVVIVFLGANDSQNIATSSGVDQFGSAAWKAAYAGRVGQIMTEATAAGARVIWVGMPVMEDPTLSSNMAMMDSIFQSEAATHKGVIYLSSWPIFSNSAGQYTSTKTGPSGQTWVLRDPDGIHLDSDGGDLLAAAVVEKMNSSFGLHLPVLQPPS
jgi:hypothetical protein